MSDLMHTLMVLSLFLLAGFMIRELVKPLQRLYIPSSVIGGVLALIAGPQVLGLVEMPEAFSSLPGVLVAIIMTALVFGVSITMKRVKNYAGYALLIMIVFGTQIGIGTALGWGMSALWPDLPHGWGLMGSFAFFGGHGTSAAAGSVFEEQGIPANFGVGMILATIGLVAAIVIGMMVVNWGVRKKVTALGVESEAADGTSTGPVLGGILPEKMQQPLGLNKVPPVGINGLALQFALLMLCYALGSLLLWALGLVIPALAGVPDLVKGMIGAVILWPVLVGTGKQEYVDRKTIGAISGFTLEVIILTAIATLELDLVTAFLVPILTYSAIMVGITVVLCLYFARRLSTRDWFEKSLISFGQGTGNTPTGLALLRTVDPELKTSAGDSAGVAAAITTPIVGLAPALLPVLIMPSQGAVVSIGLGLALLCVILGRLFFWNKSA